jgi:hypothetical protein
MAPKRCFTKNSRQKPTKSAGAPTTIVYTEALQMALSGGMFDARIFFKKQKATGLEEVDEQSKMVYRNKVKLMDLLCQRADLVTGALAWVEDKFLGVSLSKKSSAALRDVPFWPSTYIYMEKVPKCWRGEFLQANLSEWGLTNDYLTILDSAFPTAINEIFDFVLAFNSKAKIPRVCLEKATMASFFSERMRDMGRATKEWLEKLTHCFATNPCVIDWGAAGCYTIVRKSEDKLVLQHCSGAEVPVGEMKRLSQLNMAKVVGSVGVWFSCCVCFSCKGLGMKSYSLTYINTYINSI